MFNFLKQIQDFISGYKTYVVCIVAILGLLVAWSEGAITIIELIEGIGIAIGGITLRAGMKKGTPA